MAGIVKVGGVSIASHNAGTDVVTLDNVTLGSSTVFPAGHVKQVLQATKTEKESVAGHATKDTYVAIAADGGSGNWEQTITTTNSNKVLVSVHLSLGSTSTYTIWWRMQRGSTDFAYGTEPLSGQSSATARVRITHNNANEVSSMTWLDSPSTGTHTYRVVWQGESGVSALLNRTSSNADAASHGSLVSTITLMEVTV